MHMFFYGKKISGMLGILPKNEYDFDNEIKEFEVTKKQALRMKAVMGYGRHRLVKKTSSTSDFCIFGMEYLFGHGMLSRDEIGAVIVVTASPDYFIPHVSSIVHGECGLPKEVFCMDIPQGCCGFLMGLVQACMLLDHMAGKKAVIINADVLSKKGGKDKNLNNYPLSGDAAAITVVENKKGNGEWVFDIENDGSRRNALLIPGGGWKYPCLDERDEFHRLQTEKGAGIPESVQMDGTAVFNFVQTYVPPMITGILDSCKLVYDDIDWFLFHQPNRFMLRKLADKLSIPYEKMPMDLVENYGNSSGATIPMVTIHTLKDAICDKSFQCCLSAFGSGLSWGASVLKMGGFDFCEMVESDL